MQNLIFSLLFLKLVASGTALAAVGAPAASEFGGAALAPGAALSAAVLQEAHPLWLVLAGEGFWGAILVGIVGFVYRIARPYIVVWMEERKLSRLYLAVEAFAAKTNQDYTENMKKANADGKLTRDEAEFAFSLCKQNLVIFMQSQGVDIIKEYGDAFVDALIEFIVSQLKNPLAKAVAAPLSGLCGSAPLPPSVTEGAKPVWTGADCG